MINKVLLVVPGFLLVLISLFPFARINHAHLDFAELGLLALCLLAGFALFFALAWRVTGHFSAAAKATTYFAQLWLFFMCFAVIGRHFLQAHYNVLYVFGLFVALAGLLLLKKRSLPFSRDMQLIWLVFFLITLLMQFPSILKIACSGNHVPFYDEVEKALAGKSAASLPHVVYVVPDRYASDEALRDLYAYDNSAFTDALKARGFYVWDRKFSNYPKTFQSIAATMNMNYLDDLVARLGPDETSYVPVYRLLADNQALRILQRSGYDYIHMGNWWEPTRTNRRADHQVTYESSYSEFTRTYLSVTPAVFLNTLVGGATSIGDSCALIARQADTIVERAAQSTKPLFFFWHLFSVHEPFLYDENGACRDYWKSDLQSAQDHAAHYLNQITHTNAILLDVFDRLRAQSGREVVFMILSDEGPFPWDYLTNSEHYEFHNAPDDELQRKFSIYSALYLPSGKYGNFEAEHTSINAFRLVFNEIFAAGLPLRDHKSYSFNWDAYPYDLVDITTRLQE